MFDAKLTVPGVLVLLLVLSLNVARSVASTSEQLRVRLADGSPLVGRYMVSQSGHGIRAFLGVPYAEQPLGSLRFRVSEAEATYKTT